MKQDKPDADLDESVVRRLVDRAMKCFRTSTIKSGALGH